MSSILTYGYSARYAVAGWYGSLFTLCAGAQIATSTLPTITRYKRLDWQGQPPHLSIKIAAFAAQLLLAGITLKAMSAAPHLCQPLFATSPNLVRSIAPLLFQGFIIGATDVISWHLLKCGNGNWTHQPENRDKFLNKRDTVNKIALLPMPWLISMPQLYGTMTIFIRLAIALYDFNSEKSDQFIEKMTQCGASFKKESPQQT